MLMSVDVERHVRRKTTFLFGGAAKIQNSTLNSGVPGVRMRINAETKKNMFGNTGKIGIEPIGAEVQFRRHPVRVPKPPVC